MATVNTSGCGQRTPASSMPCVDQLRSLYDAYIKLATGQNVVEVQSADFRKVSYGPGDIAAVKAQYDALYAVCGAESGLPTLTSGGARGRLAQLGC